jgi:aspartate/methionine/tyrosine aminotransferase
MSSSVRLPSIADRMAGIGPFHVMELLKRAAELEASGRDIVHMEVGEPDFPTPQPVLTAAEAYLRKGHVHYTPALGIAPLRCAIADLYLTRHGLRVDPARVVVTAGASGALLLALGILVNPGDTILVSDPGYPCYRHFIRFFGGEARPLAVSAATDFQPTVDQVASAWSRNVKGLILASPANPTGGLVSGDCLRALGELAAQRGGALLVDEIYHGLTYGVDATTALGVADDAFIINSFSKYFGMTGWRLGWLIAPARYVRDLEKLAQNLFICASAPAQFAALAAFRPETLDILEQRRQAFQARRDFLLPALRKLGFGIDGEPRGAFYLYADIAPFGLNSQVLAQRLIEQAGVAITPGLDFGVHGAERHVRFAYTTSLERLAVGVERIDRFLAELRLPQGDAGSA